MKNKIISQIKQFKISLFKDELIFLGLLLALHIAWKTWDVYFHYKIFGVYVLGPLVAFLQKSITEITVFFLQLFDVSNASVIFYKNAYTVYYPEIKGALILTLMCSGVKQLLVFTLLMICYPGSLKNKLWFIPTGIVFLYIIRTLIFIILAFAFYYNIDLFRVLHGGSKYVYWGTVFFVWVVWVRYFKNKK
ncbi:MAG: hypothetical protein A2275_17445 [Bacteroidetes bacterium RIFOXYA12_FULL_35_11]|nr:MAG: hypothetical protein A2X01_19755 [Bacteroidetes bacterium GWF2_35_48]OFY76264.1 MAG: hypothetical protein A2275_17445 [Bacteroidetes bacterium RIFOXYA12_FULL_35_11]OFY92555.1 MAG: hypothetical protein A2491_10150 [Bacteroidetes bacterium RIFOXYC12_FULL_35_7]HBX52674.1 hypothetical protein [Bacteroidales bacterium]